MNKVELQKTKEFSDWICGTVLHIYDVYGDDNTYIVISKNEEDSDELYDITRFFLIGDRLETSVDHTDLSLEEMLDLLLTKYTARLK